MGILWFLLGMVTGGAVAFLFLCLIQWNRTNFYEAEIRKLKEQIAQK